MVIWVIIDDVANGRLACHSSGGMAPALPLAYLIITIIVTRLSPLRYHPSSCSPHHNGQSQDFRPRAGADQCCE